jgi:N-acetyl-1-D-myo-inositol-2-amino-2-deoxy-alpha-D-glucopyranoside deacetylase
VADDVLRRACADLPGAPAVQAVLRDDPRLTLPAPDGPLPSVAVAPGGIAVRVDVTGVLDRVAAALAEHRTQVASIAVDVPAGVAEPQLAGCYALSNHVVAPLLTHESYRLAPGHPRAPVVWPAAVRPVR